ncbi:MAG: DUF5916 domain-containing protein [Gemmatimonadaceae bacterium]
MMRPGSRRVARGIAAAVVFSAVVSTNVTGQATGDSVAAGQRETGVRREASADRRSGLRKQAAATALGNGEIDIDGQLSEEVWESATPVTDFTQKQPVEGAAPTEATEVRFLYGEDALYVGARMFSDDPSAIQAPVGRRDDGGQSEHLLISLDPYLDRRTAYTFGVTASSVRIDWYHPADNEYHTDMSFDPVWQARARIDSVGWTAEMRIPYSQLRFNAGARQVWGMNIDRWIPSRKEDVFWIPVPTDVQAWSSYFGNLTGIEGIEPSRRIELLPYVATDATLRGDVDPLDPFTDDREFGGRVGGDLKMGLGPNLTLEATVNPDFGQVEADPAEVNLSQFETFFSERRPFFIEGAQLLQGNGPGYFYSRRIGAAPFGAALNPYDYDYTDFPSTSTILGAAKLTGRLASGTSLGALAAVTDGENARIYDVATGGVERVRVAPLTAYGVARAQQQFGAAASTAGLILTGVQRRMNGDSNLEDILTNSAVTGGGDWNLRFRQGEYSLSGHAGFSYIDGNKAAITHVQRSPARYFQRPDADHLEFDPTRTVLAGYTYGIGFSRNSGDHWLWELYTQAASPGFELNDAGRISNVDGRFFYGNLRYRETTPGTWFRSYSVALSSENEYDFGAVRTFGAVRSDVELTFSNFWELNLTGWTDFRAQSPSHTRGGPYLGAGQAWVGIARLANSFASSTRWNGRVYYGENEQGEVTYRLSGGISFRPGPQWRFSADPNYLRSINPRQYITTLDRPAGDARTFGNRYVFSFIDRSTFLVQLRATYTFKPDLTLELYAEPFAASGRYYDFGELPAARSYDLRFYGAAPGTSADRQENGDVVVTETLPGGPDSFTLPFRDFNVRSFRSNMVLRWEWRAGSTFYVVWQQDRFGDEAEGSLVSAGDLFDSFSAVGDNFLAVKASFWIPVN